MGKKDYKFVFTGLTENGSRISPTTVHKSADSAKEAKKLALATFKNAYHAFKVLSCEPKNKK